MCCAFLLTSLTVCRHRHGLGVPRSVSEAVRLYKLAAAENLPCAQFNLGFMFQMGLGVEQDINEAIRLYKCAADQGDCDARHSLLHIGDFTQFIRTYSATLPHYVAICRAVAAWLLQRRLPSKTRAPLLTQVAPPRLLAACAAVRVLIAARIGVCSSGWASLAAAKLLQVPHGVTMLHLGGDAACKWGRVIAARVLGLRCSVLKVGFHPTAAVLMPFSPFDITNLIFSRE